MCIPSPVKSDWEFFTGEQTEAARPKRTYLKSQGTLKTGWLTFALLDDVAFQKT